jgi:integrase
MNLAEAWGLRSGGSNPCIHVQRYRENRRERFLSTSELQALGRGLADADHTSTVAWQVTSTVRLLILTGSRLSEICELSWDQVDLDAGLIRMPETKTGSRVIYITAPVAEVLGGLPRSEEIPWVVPAIKEPSRPLSISTAERGWRRIKKQANIPDVRLHDLRHSHASVAASAGLSLPIIGKLLGHNTPTTTARYAHLADDPVRRAAEAVSGTISAVMLGKKGEVVELVPVSSP